MEALWKHEGENCCAIVPICAQIALVVRSRNWQIMRKKARFVAPDRISFDMTHNLKVVGSNPTPATKIIRLIKDFKAELNARLSSLQILVNTWSTFYEPPIEGADNRRQYRHSANS